MAEVKAKKTIASNATKVEKKATVKKTATVKAVVEKKTVQVAKAPVEKVEETVAVAKPTTKSVKSISLDVYGVDGKVAGKVSVSGLMFGEKVNKTLIAQAVRVYLANKRLGTASTKTRGEVDGSTRKIYRQKGTGRARHGSLRAPIFVKGGVVFGPRPHDYSLDLPKKMKKKALFSALSAKLQDKEVTVVAGFETLEPKTKVFVGALQKLGFDGKKRSILLVIDAKAAKVKQAGRNVTGVTFIGANLLNTLDVIKSKNLVIMKDALSEMEKTFLPKESIRQAQDK